MPYMQARTTVAKGPRPGGGRAARRWLLPLALFGSALLAGQALAGPKDFAVYTPGMGGDPETAKPYIDKFAQQLDSALGWPAGSSKGTFFVTRKEAVAGIDATKPGFAVVEPSLYFDLRKTHKAEALAQVDSPDLNSPKYSVVVKNPAYKSLADLAGKKLWTTLADSPKYLGSVVLDGKGAAETRFALKGVGIYTKAVRAVIRGEADATLLNDQQLAEAKKMEGGADLRVIYESPALPPLLVVSLDAALGDAEAKKLTKTLLSICGQPAGGEICKQMHIQKFVPVNSAVLSAAQKRYEQP
jgi:ABC-type phosphate/phosphonate transport system substrate-binding protein